MIIKKLFVNVKLDILNPYVVRLEHGKYAYSLELQEFRKILTSTKKLISGDWGYSNPKEEYLYSKESGKQTGNSFSLFNSYLNLPETRIRSYWAFADEMDAVQFKLSNSLPSMHTKMWPSSTTFTITRYIEVEDFENY